MTTKIFGITPELQPGRMYWLTPYEGSCDNCGKLLIADNLPVIFVGVYEDARKNPYWLFENCMWTKCVSCGGFITTFNLFMEGINATHFSLFAKVAQ